MITDQSLRLACVHSPRFADLTRDLDLKKMAKVPSINFSPLSEEERLVILDWATGKWDVVPSVIADYIARCK